LREGLAEKPRGTGPLGRMGPNRRGIKCAHFSPVPSHTRDNGMMEIVMLRENVRTYLLLSSNDSLI
jgi:hypothetical protein